MNDLVGGSNLVDYKDVGHVSPSSLRYAKVLSDILVLFKKKKFKKIAEIGTGYGGQFLIFDIDKISEKKGRAVKRSRT